MGETDGQGERYICCSTLHLSNERDEKWQRMNSDIWFQEKGPRILCIIEFNYNVLKSKLLTHI